MNFLGQKLRASPIHARVVPYVLMVVLTVFQDSFEGSARFWMYGLKMLVGAWCIWEVRDLVPEMRWSISWEAVVVGVLVCVMWVGINPYYPKFGFLFKVGDPWNPFKHYGDHSTMGLFFVALRIGGSALIVPPIEETFFRSFLYRYFVRLDFEGMPMNRLHWLSLVVTSALFGLAHYQWLAGFLTGLAFQWLVLRKNRLGDAMVAHGITNFLLGLWIYWKGDWQFW